jgi:hypothetical protein
MKSGKEVNGTSIVSRGDMSEVLELVEEALDPVAQFVGGCVVRDEDFSGAEGGDDRGGCGVYPEKSSIRPTIAKRMVPSGFRTMTWPD